MSSARAARPAPNRSGRRSKAASDRISRPSIPRRTIPPSSSTPRAPREIRKARCMPIACCSAICRMSRWCMTSCRKPGDVMWTPADWAWIGGLFDALFPAWYHGVPVVGHRAKKFEPQAAMQLMADHGVRNVFLPPTALKLMRQAKVRHPGVKLRSMLTGGELLGAELLAMGARDLRHRRPRGLWPDRMQSRGRQQFKTVSDPPGFDGQGDAGFRRPHRQRARRGIADRRARHHRRASTQSRAP